MTERQKAEVALWLRIIRESRTCLLRHGGCVGADEQCDTIAVGLGFDRDEIHVHPADVDESKKAAFTVPGLEDGRVVHPMRAPLDRNRDIVDNCQVLLAAPRQRAEEQRSGTWATIRYARKVGRTTVLIWP